MASRRVSNTQVADGAVSFAPRPPARRAPRRPLRALDELADPGPSTLLRVVAGLFTINGAMGLIGLAALLVMLAAGGAPGEARELFRQHPLRMGWGLAMSAMTAGGWFYTGVLLRERRRFGGVLAVTTFALSFVTSAVRGRPFVLDTVIALIGILLLWRVWRELD